METAAQSTEVLTFEDAYEVVREHCHQIMKAGDRPSEEVLLMQGWDGCWLSRSRLIGIFLHSQGLRGMGSPFGLMIWRAE